MDTPRCGIVRVQLHHDALSLFRSSWRIILAAICLVTQPRRKACLGFRLGDVISTYLAHSHDATLRSLPMMIGRIPNFCFFVLKGGARGFLLSEELDSVTANRSSEARLFPPGLSRSQMILAKCVCSPPSGRLAPITHPKMSTH